MIKANHKRFWVWLSGYYSRWLLKYFFRNIKYRGEYAKTDLPVLIIGNHFSWFDGFIQIQLNNNYFRRRYHFMMLEKELKKSMILTTIGAFSVSKGQRSSLESLQYAVEILKDPKNLFLFFPQGSIQSLYTQDFVFEKGALSYILENAKNKYQFVFNVNLFDYGSKRKPEITVYFNDYELKEGATADTIEEDFNAYAKECLKKQTRK